MSLVKNMLCGKLHCQKGFDLILFSLKFCRVYGVAAALQFAGFSRLESLILSHHYRKVTCECNEEEIHHHRPPPVQERTGGGQNPRIVVMWLPRRARI